MSLFASIRYLYAALPITAASLQQPFRFISNQTTPAMAPVICVSHGGGPMPILGDPSHTALVKSMREKVPEILKLGTAEAPRAIVLVTAHWSTTKPTISSAKKHGLLYDYYGFPPESYQIKYDAPGSPEVAKEVAEAFENVGLLPEFDEERGWDHGVFIPMLLINPKADIPIVQISVLKSEDPHEHFKMGRALAKLRERNVAIVGSGFATLHNLRHMFSGVTEEPEFRALNAAWSSAVTDAVKEANIDERERKLVGWRKYPASYEMHPRGGAEHFLPLIVCAGAGGEQIAKFYADEFVGLDMFSYYWE
ncbi:extradiol ring-cleavage dioxygenase [Phyllosticta citricarpa]